MPDSLESVDSDVEGGPEAQSRRGQSGRDESVMTLGPQRPTLTYLGVELDSELETFAERWVVVFRIYLELLTMACTRHKRSGLLSPVPSPSVPLCRACAVHRLETSP